MAIIKITETNGASAKDISGAMKKRLERVVFVVEKFTYVILN